MTNQFKPVTVKEAKEYMRWLNQDGPTSELAQSYLRAVRLLDVFVNDEPTDRHLTVARDFLKAVKDD